MKKIKTLLIIPILILGLCTITGCSNKENDNKLEKEEAKTIAGTLSKAFESEIKKEKDIEKIAKKIADNEAIVPEVQTYSIAKDEYLTGFKEEIKGFNQAVGIAPMISTIPFIAYVFEVENPKDFAKTLEDNAQLNWNICTQADEMKVTIVDNYVFFIMSPTSFEE